VALLFQGLRRSCRNEHPPRLQSSLTLPVQSPHSPSYYFAFIHAFRKAAQRWLVPDDVGILLPTFKEPIQQTGEAVAEEEDDSEDEIIVMTVKRRQGRLLEWGFC
jgi:hypothetical protein